MIKEREIEKEGEKFIRSGTERQTAEVDEE